MKNDQIIDAIGMINDEAVHDAKAYQRPQSRRWIKWGALAACVCIVFAFILVPSLNEQPTTPINGGGGAENGGSFFNATVLEVTEDTVSVECVDSMDSDFTNGDIISFGTQIVAANGLPDIVPGDTIRIIYNDTSVNKDTLRIDIVFAVYLVDDSGNVLPN